METIVTTIAVPDNVLDHIQELTQIITSLISKSDFALYVILRVPEPLKKLKFITYLLQYMYSLQVITTKNRFNCDFKIALEDFVSLDYINAQKPCLRVFSHKFSFPLELVEESTEELDLSHEKAPVLGKGLLEIVKKIENFLKKNFERVEFEQTGINTEQEAVNPDDQGLKFSRKSCQGGTFDHMHFGHKIFLSVGALSSKALFIGVTSNAMLQKKKFNHVLEAVSKRKFNVKKFLDFFDKTLDLTISEITDGLGNYKDGKNAQSMCIYFIFRL